LFQIFSSGISRKLIFVWNFFEKCFYKRLNMLGYLKRNHDLLKRISGMGLQTKVCPWKIFLSSQPISTPFPNRGHWPLMTFKNLCFIKVKPCRIDPMQYNC
jgi:hypothetical protein